MEARREVLAGAATKRGDRGKRDQDDHHQHQKAEQEDQAAG